MPQEAQSQFEMLIQSLQLKDSRLYDALVVMNRSLLEIWNELNPIIAAQNAAATAVTTPPDVVTSFDFTITKQSIHLFWSSADGSAVFFEIRDSTGGLSWDNSPFVVRTPSLSADLNPRVPGTYTYLIKSINASGTYSTASRILSLTISPIGAISLTAIVIDNNVQLKWTEPTAPFNIAYYKLYRGGVFQGTKSGTFTVIFETVSGTYTYGISAVDIAGYESAISTVSALVNQPPDFVLQDSRISTFSGTKTNCRLEGVRLLCLINTTENFEDHFIVGSETGKPWASPQAQVTAGYPIYIQPAKTTGSYQEVIDYGGIFTNVIITLSWAFEIVTGSFTISSTLEVSNDNITYSSPVAGPSVFFTSVRYLRLTINFTGIDDKALMYFSDLKIAMSVKQITDSGNVSALASDTNGTTVNFNVAFKDVNGITLDAVAVKKDVTAMVDFTDVPNPTNFKVYVFDAVGQRVDATVGWVARGVV